MKPAVHVLAALAAAACAEEVVHASECGGAWAWVAAALAAVLPDVAESLLTCLFRRPDATFVPDPLLSDDALAESALDGLASAVDAAVGRHRPLHLHVRPLPASRGRLFLRLLRGRAEALVLPPGTDSATPVSWKGATRRTLPLSDTPWPAAIEIPAPSGCVLSFRECSGKKRTVAAEVFSRRIGRGLPHSPFALLAVPPLLFVLFPESPVVLAFAAGLLSHGILDIFDDIGLPRPFRTGPNIGLFLWRTDSPFANRMVSIVSAAVLLLALVENTSFILHRQLCHAVVFLAAAAAIAADRSRKVARRKTQDTGHKTQDGKRQV